MDRKEFIHHDGALGDVLLSLPCIRAIGGRCGHLSMAGRLENRRRKEDL